MSPTGASRPLTSSYTSSGTPPTRVATTGNRPPPPQPAPTRAPRTPPAARGRRRAPGMRAPSDAAQNLPGGFGHKPVLTGSAPRTRRAEGHHPPPQVEPAAAAARRLPAGPASASARPAGRRTAPGAAARPAAGRAVISTGENPEGTTCARPGGMPSAVSGLVACGVSAMTAAARRSTGRSMGPANALSNAVRGVSGTLCRHWCAL
jgi:hypothetical protein